MCFKIKVVSLLGLIMCSIFISHSVAQDQKDFLIKASDMVVQGKLKNGFTYYLKYVPDRKVSTNFVVRAGFNQESADQIQVSHVIEHLAYRETKNFKNALRYFQERGFKLGSSDIKASTENDRTVYRFNVPAKNDSLLKSTLAFFRDVAHDINLTPDNIDQERPIVIEELGRFKESPSFKAGNIVVKSLMGSTIYAEIANCDPYESLRTFKHSSLISYYNAYYVPNSQALIIVGDFNVKTIEKEISQLFSDLLPSKESAENNFLKGTEFFQWRRQFVPILNSTLNRSIVDVYIKAPRNNNHPQSSNESAAISKLCNELLHYRFESVSKGFKHARDVSTIFGTERVRGPEIDYLKTSFSFHTGFSSEAAGEIITELARLKKYGFDSLELVSAKKRIQYGYQHTSDISQTIIDGFIYGWDINELMDQDSIRTGLLSKLDVGRVNTEIKKWLDIQENIDVFQYYSDSTRNLLNDKEFFSLVDKIDGSQVTPFKTRELIQYKNKYLLDSETISQFKNTQFTKKTSNKTLGIIRLLLANGVEVFLKPIKSNSESSQIVLQQLNLQSELKESQLVLEKYGHAFVSNSGLGVFNPEELLQFYLDNNIQHVTLANSKAGSSLRADFDPGSLEKVLQAIWLYAVNPKLDSSVYKSIITQTMDYRSNERSATTLGDTISNLLIGNERQKLLEQLSRLKMEDVMPYFKKRFSFTKNTKFVVSGDFDVDVYSDLISRYLGNIPVNRSNGNYRSLRKANDKFIEKDLKIYSGSAGRAEVHLQWDFKIGNELRNKVALEFLVEILNVRLMQRLRMDEGAVYSYYASSNVHRGKPKTAVLIVGFETSVEKYLRLIEIVKEEVLKMKRDFIDPNVFARIRKSRTTELKESCNSPNFWAEYILDQIKSGDPFCDIHEELRLSKELTEEDVRSFADKFLLPELMNNYILLPRQS